MEKYLIVIFIAYISVVLFGYWLEYLNIAHLKKYGNIVPADFEGQVDITLLKKTQEYTVTNSLFKLLSSIYHNVILLVFLFGGVLNIYNSWVASFQLSFILSGLVFFMLLYYAETFLSVPFSIYQTFKIEKKFGFNTMTLRLWITDLMKTILISTILMTLLISGGILLIEKSPEFWWFWVWCFFFGFSIFIIYVSPYVIEPLFNKYTPIDDETLLTGIRGLMQKVGIRVSRVFKIDASKRTKHTNAYFTGIGKVKRIVLFDTLLDRLNVHEILSVLAHEAGHWKKKHILKYIVVTECVALIALYLSFRILKYDFLIELFKLEESTFFAKVVILGFLGSLVSFPFSPLFHYFSRRHEIEADSYSCSLTGSTESMITSLVKLSRDNLSNLHPHPLYTAFHYSHPPILERIRRIRGFLDNDDSTRRT